MYMYIQYMTITNLYIIYSSYGTYIQYCTTQSYRVATIHTVVYCNILYSRCWFHLLPNIIKTKQWLIAWLIDRLTDAWWHDFPSYSLHSTAGGARCRNNKIPERHMEETAFWTLWHYVIGRDRMTFHGMIGSISRNSGVVAAAGWGGSGGRRRRHRRSGLMNVIEVICWWQHRQPAANSGEVGLQGFFCTCTGCRKPGRRLLRYNKK